MNGTVDKRVPVLAAHDFSACGLYALNVVLPVLKALPVELYAIPTMVLTSTESRWPYVELLWNEGFAGYLEAFRSIFAQLGVVYTGYFPNAQHLEQFFDFVRTLSLDPEHQRPLCCVDPVLGDGGLLYPHYTSGMVEAMKAVLLRADVIFPNLTEVCLLLDKDYAQYSEGMEMMQVRDFVVELADKGPRFVILKGIFVKNSALKDKVLQNSPKIYTFFYDREKECLAYIEHAYYQRSFSGTGDLLATLFVGFLSCDRVFYRNYFTSRGEGSLNGSLPPESILKRDFFLFCQQALSYVCHYVNLAQRQTFPLPFFLKSLYAYTDLDLLKLRFDKE